MLLLIAMIFVSSFAYAQTLQDAVYLNNGNIIRGIILEIVPNDFIKIKTYDGSVFVYKTKDILKIKKEEAYTPQYTIKKEEDFRKVKSKRKRLFLELGHTLGEDNKFELSGSLGYQFSPHFFSGLGCGIDYFYEESCCGFPVFVHLRSDLTKNKVSPFIETKFGYSFFDTCCGYFTTAFGYRFPISKKLAVNVSLGYVYEYSSGLNLKFNLDF